MLMFNRNDKHYIFKQSNDRIWNFFHDEKNGLCYSILTKRSTWSEPASLFKNANKDFYVDMDSDDVFHILFQDSKGNIFYSRLSSQGTETKPILNSKVPTQYNKHLFLIPLRDDIHTFYVLYHNENMILAHQIIGNGSMGTPRVVDYVADKDHPYSIICDNAGNIDVVYQSSDGRHLQLGYKRYSREKKAWSEFTPITKFNGTCEFPQLISDSSGMIHMSFQRCSNRQYELVYMHRMPGKTTWSDSMVVHSSSYPFINSSIVNVDGKLSIFWIRDETTYYSYSVDAGSTWSKPARYNFPTGKQLFCMSYKSNASHEAGKIQAPCVSGSYVGGLMIAFYPDVLSASSASISADELRSMLLDSLKYLKSSVQELKQAETNTCDVLSKLTSSQQETEKELVKNSVKLNILENEINKLKEQINNIMSIVSKSNSQ